jgi:hypothetical protein
MLKVEFMLVRVEALKLTLPALAPFDCSSLFELVLLLLMLVWTCFMLVALKFMRRKRKSALPSSAVDESSNDVGCVRLLPYLYFLKADVWPENTCSENLCVSTGMEGGTEGQFFGPLANDGNVISSQQLSPSLTCNSVYVQHSTLRNLFYNLPPIAPLKKKDDVRSFRLVL